MQKTVKNRKGNSSKKKVTLPDSVFGVEPHEHLVYLETKRYMASQRSGTHSTKQRAEVRGSGVKIRPQKGTGRARAGDIKNPIFKGGGIVFGPKPRDHSFKLNKKERSLAKRSALSHQYSNKAVQVIKDFSLKEPKTKKIDEILENFDAKGDKVLLVFNELDENIYLSVRNIPKTKALTVDRLNIFDILNADHIIITQSAVENIEDHLLPKKEKNKV